MSVDSRLWSLGNRESPEPHQKGDHVCQRKEQQKVAQGPAPESILNGIQGGDGNGSTQEQPKKYQLWKNWKATWKKFEAIEKFTFCLVVFTIISSAADVYQSYMMRETLVASQRPAVYLGLPDGKIADFVLQEGKETITLYFRNYGQSTARNTIIEIWPVFMEPMSGSVSSITIPSPQWDKYGPDLPPGFPDVRYQPLLNVTREELATGKKNLTIVGRIQYDDSFREYCDVFSIRYARPSSQFVFEWGRDMGPMDLCGKDVAVVSFVTTPRKEKNLFTQDHNDKEVK